MMGLVFGGVIGIWFLLFGILSVGDKINKELKEIKEILKENNK